MVGCIQGAAEVPYLAQAAGADPARMRQALPRRSAGSRVREVFGGGLVEHDFPADDEARLRHKDYGTVMGKPRRLGAPAPVSGQVGQQLNALVANAQRLQHTATLGHILEKDGSAI